MGKRSLLRPDDASANAGERAADVQIIGAGLRYIGDGAGIIGIPARDIPAAELETVTYDGVALVQSGLYAVHIEVVPLDDQEGAS